jgi:hypothetical protein
LQDPKRLALGREIKVRVDCPLRAVGSTSRKPVGCLTISGNAQEGNQFIPLKEQLSCHHPNTKIDVADAKYDELHNYEYARTLHSIPLIDYNVRNENVSLDALKLRGYDRNGWPFAPCGLLCQPNGFDYQFQRVPP